MSSNSKRDPSKYKKLADQWHVRENDPSILTIEAVDDGFAAFQEQNEYVNQQLCQWMTITTQLLKLVGEQNQEIKNLGSNTEKLSAFLEVFAQRLQTSSTPIKPLQDTLNQLSQFASALSSKLNTIQSDSRTLLSDLEAREERICEKVEALSDRITAVRVWQRITLVSCSSMATMVVLFASGGWMLGMNAGRSQVIEQFGSESNLDYWKQAREQNRDRILQCREQGLSECSIQLP